ncbi:hypothetical protein DRF58_11600 [Epilithonimonas hispanica]|uniref:Uncharacterized protein n=1 Tax=Epilithonimonas hispanica TaxID=358687 RepID=A0A3D9CVX9_9FLAO|nr:hypothetical protein DRF58_11600 [Epilithonimonas hispanica]
MGKATGGLVQHILQAGRKFSSNIFAIFTIFASIKVSYINPRLQKYLTVICHFKTTLKNKK